MKTFATLLAIVAIAAGANAADFSSTGSSAETSIIKSCSDQCTQPLYYNHDNSFENGFCWQYGGIVAPTYGAFGEGFSLGAGCVACIAIWATQIGYYSGQTCDLYIWDGGVTGIPGNVLWTAVGQSFTSIPYWPTLGQNDFVSHHTVYGEFTAGYWADFSTGQCAWYIGADQDGFGGYPWTNIAPGIGYPTGWQNPALIWGTCQSLGFGVYFVEGFISPVEASTWGAIKSFF